MSEAYIEQVGGSAAVGAPVSEANLADEIAAMQVPPDFRLAPEERAAMLATAPEQLSVRLGNIVLGKVAVRSEAGEGVSVQLSGLLDLLEDRFEPETFERMRGAAGADAFVSVTRLADSGIAIDYDAAYDELTIG